ncbi:MAG: YihY/virulence factor BrkB family protein [Leptospiraceae bacterium]|nr:YihY/virulence factor BrkB family protein [Leptospiraceae bacterium]
MAESQKPGLVLRIKDFFAKTLSGEFDETRKLQRKLQSSILFAMATFRKFLDDEVLLRSASISYAIVVSFVPTLVVVMMVGSRFIDIELYFDRIADFARLNGLKIDLEPYFNIIREFLKNAGAIGGVGFLVLLFSATSVLRNIEDAINRIWRVNRKRPMLQKIAGFIMVMVFGPAVLAVGISLAQSILAKFASPNFRQVHIAQDTVQILGDKQVFLVQSEKGKPFKEKNILRGVDYEVDNQRIVFNGARNTIIPESRKDIVDSAARADASMLRNAVFVDYARSGNTEFIITENGILLISKDGNKFRVRRFYREQEGRVYEVSFRRMQFITERSAVIIGSDGLILRTTDGGETWQPNYQQGLSANLHQIARLRPGAWLLVGDDSTALLTEDAGETFTPFKPVLSALRPRRESITGIAVAENYAYIVGEAGLLLVSRDAGTSWKPVATAETLFFQDVAAAPDGNAVAVGRDGLLRYTRFLPDSTIEWEAFSDIPDVDLHAVRYFAKESKFIAVGDHYVMLQALHDGNKPDSMKSFKIIQKAPLWRRVISALGNLLIPFLVIFLLFFTLYKVIPYTFVQWRAAAIGATVTSISWVIFLLLYKYYVTHFSKGTAALYGTLALVPLTLLLLYVSALIVLFGAEIAFFNQYPQLLRLSKKAELAERHKRQLWYGISILRRLAQAFFTGKNDCTTDVLIKYTSGDQEEFKFIMERLAARNYVTETENHRWVLAMHPDLIRISTLLEDLDPSDYSIPDYNPKDSFMRKVKEYFDQLELNRGRVFRNVTLAQLMQGD